jgi:hypothetical protein
MDKHQPLMVLPRLADYLSLVAGRDRRPAHPPPRMLAQLGQMESALDMGSMSS